MKSIKITINQMGNAAFVDHPEGPEGEVARILREIADKVEAGRTSIGAIDINGNSVGKVEIK